MFYVTVARSFDCQTAANAVAALAFSSIELLTDENSIVKLSQLVQQLRFRLVYRKLLPLDFYWSAGISLSRQQHSRFIPIESEKNRPRLEFLRRRSVGVVGHGLEKVTLGPKPLLFFLEIFVTFKINVEVILMLTDRPSKRHCGCFATSAKKCPPRGNTSAQFSDVTSNVFWES